MTNQEERAAKDRLRRAVMAFQRAQVALLKTHRELRTRPPVDLSAFWDGKGRRIAVDVEAAARELVAAFRAFSAAGSVISAADWHQVSEAKRYIKVGGA
ncbi:MAG TPA: hypothetical protein VIL69_08005 [Roseomonas sp.]|jgi:hypothetical protein